MNPDRIVAILMIVYAILHITIGCTSVLLRSRRIEKEHSA